MKFLVRVMELARQVQELRADISYTCRAMKKRDGTKRFLPQRHI